MGNWFASLFGFGARERTPLIRLPEMAGDPDTLAMLGFSSGSFMTNIMHVVHSDTIKGAGLMMGGAYSWADLPKPAPDDAVQQLVDIADGFASQGKIDPTSNLNGAPVYIISGAQDDYVEPFLQEAQRDFYNNYNAELVYSSIDLHHDIPWNGISTILHFIYENIPSSGVTASDPQGMIHGDQNNNDWQDAGRLYRFDQSEFTDATMEEANLKDHGVIYIPNYCMDNDGCKVVFSNHGCTMGSGEVYINNDYGHVQFAGWNNLIMVFPFSHQDCHSLTSTVDPNFNNKDGLQVKAFKAMIDRVLSAKDPSFDFDENVVPPSAFTQPFDLFQYLFGWMFGK